MGDHRATVKVEFSMYGETKKCNMWINWSPSSDYEGIDQRVLDFFTESYNQMYFKQLEYESREARKSLERVAEQQERQEYERLKAKFEGTNK